MKVTKTLSTLGRRNKQTILKDFVRPDAAQTISDSQITSTPGSPGTGGGGNPDCTVILPDPISPCGDFGDDFNRVVAAGWGGDGIGGEWSLLNYGVFIPDENRRNWYPAVYGVNSGAGVFDVALDPEPGVGEVEVYWGTSALLLGYSRQLNTSTITHRVKFNAEAGTEEAFLLSANVPEPPADTSSVWQQFSTHTVSVAWSVSSGEGMSAVHTGAADSSPLPAGFFVTGQDYILEIEISANLTIGRLWPADDEGNVQSRSDVGTTLETVGLIVGRGGGDSFQINPVGIITLKYVGAGMDGGAPIGCIPQTSEGGTYQQTLVRESYYWRPSPAPTGTIYYGQIWFDGIAVWHNQHYTLEDGYKVVPIDTSLPTDTVVEAEITVP